MAEYSNHGKHVGKRSAFALTLGYIRIGLPAGYS